jgi:hypothetical protein
MTSLAPKPVMNADRPTVERMTNVLTLGEARPTSPPRLVRLAADQNIGADDDNREYNYNGKYFSLDRHGGTHFGKSARVY